MADDLYGDVGKRLDTVLGTRKELISVWIGIKKARQDFDKTRDSDQYDGFMEHMRDEYGIQMHYDKDGNIQQEFHIVDEKKYIFFKLKYE